MVKVHMITAEGRKTDLLPDTMTLGAVWDYFGQETVHTVKTVNGRALAEEDPDKPLHAFAKDDTVSLTSFPEPAVSLRVEAGFLPEASPEPAAGSPGEYACSGIYESLARAKDALEDALKVFARLKARDSAYGESGDSGDIPMPF